MSSWLILLILSIAVGLYAFYRENQNQSLESVRAESPIVHINGIDLHVEDSGPSKNKDTIVFSHGLFMNTRSWDHQVDFLKSSYRCIVYDHRGQGKSQVPVDVDEISLDQLVQDAVSLIETLKVAPGFHLSSRVTHLNCVQFIGLAARRPDLIKSLVLVDTSSEPELDNNNVERQLLMLFVRWFGFNEYVFGEMDSVLFAPGYPPEQVEQRRKLFYEPLKPNVYKAVSGVFYRYNFTDQLPNIKSPTLILHGEKDIAFKSIKAEDILHRQIKGSILVIVPKAGHQSPTQEPEFVNQEILKFLQSLAH